MECVLAKCAYVTASGSVVPPKSGTLDVLNAPAAYAMTTPATTRSSRTHGSGEPLQRPPRLPASGPWLFRSIPLAGVDSHPPHPKMQPCTKPGIGVRGRPANPLKGV